MSPPPPQPLRLPSNRNVPSSWSRWPPANGRRAQGESNPGSYTSTSAVKILATPGGTALAISVFRPGAEKGYRLLFHTVLLKVKSLALGEKNGSLVWSH
ncbi:hypothetical protein MUK42_20918 [Musa troglodytarum]|uniref:Uncharacterized protein n=1 Tax=Musa troglodytarum TaxID=320322 RepID=A0A9E7K3Z5_9LILI|nr:hypothetical protein MUK42_20918 [Musa troglodytarum]